ncbi:MAG: hypothetical protein ACRBCS_16035 [Cellvibrionaceae bacterium]
MMGFYFELICISLFGIAGFAFTLFFAFFAYEYLKSLDPKKKSKIVFLAMLVGSILMVSLNYLFFSGTVVGDIMLSSLVGFLGFGTISGLLYLANHHLQKAKK